MPKKGMRTLCFTFKQPPSWPSPSRESSLTYSVASTPRRNAQSMIERSITTADLLITKWNPDTPGYAQVTSLFHENRQEAMDFIKCVNNLQKSMHLISHEDPFGHMIRAQNLMQIAMKRLQKELYQILSTNRAHLDPESVSTRSSHTSSRTSLSSYEDATLEDDIQAAENTLSEVEQVSLLAMENLRRIAECMIASGYGKECLKIYNIIRKSIIDEGLYKLGIEKTTPHQFNKLAWEIQDMKIQRWLHAIKIATKTLFAGERILCDHVFESSAAARESCFGEISREGANLLFTFPEIVAKSRKASQSAEKLFRVLDMYTSIVEHWSEIESIFSFDSNSQIRTQALTSISKLGESARLMVSEFESAVQKDSTKTAALGGDVDPLTIYVMNTLSNLADYNNVLNEILTNHPLPAKSESLIEASRSPTSAHMEWTILVLISKLDLKSEVYKDVSISYLFLANNLQHIVMKVLKSNLRFMLGEDWIKTQEAKIKQFAESYMASVWIGVWEALPANTSAAMAPAPAREVFRKFNSRFGEAYRKQSSCVVADQKLRDEIKSVLEKNIVARYRDFYERNRSVIGGGGGGGSLNLVARFAPEDVGNYLSDLYFDDDRGDPESGSPSSLPSVFPASSSF